VKLRTFGERGRKAPNSTSFHPTVANGARVMERQGTARRVRCRTHIETLYDRVTLDLDRVHEIHVRELLHRWLRRIREEHKP